MEGGDPDDFSDTETNCETEIDFKNANVSQELCDLIKAYEMQLSKTQSKTWVHT